LLWPGQDEDEDETAALAVAYIKAKRPEFLFVHLGRWPMVGRQPEFVRIRQRRRFSAMMNMP